LKGVVDASDLLGLNVVYVANLKPRKLRGVISEGMLLAAEDDDGNVSVLTICEDLAPGSIVR
jgi:methionyl-tRNA synthetase